MNFDPDGPFSPPYYLYLYLFRIYLSFGSSSRRETLEVGPEYAG